MRSNSQMMGLVMLWLASCSGELRTKPQLACEPGADTTAIVCSDGIIGSCAGGSAQYSVCSDLAVCQASWQQAGAYKCSQTDLPDDAGLLTYVRGSSDASLQGVALRVIGDSNADGILTPGEAGTFSIELRNATDSVVHNVTGTLRASHPGVTITSGSELYFGRLEGRGSACGSSTPELAGSCSDFSALTKIQIAESVPLGAVSFELTVRGDLANDSTLNFELTLPANSRL